MFRKVHFKWFSALFSIACTFDALFLVMNLNTTTKIFAQLYSSAKGSTKILSGSKTAFEFNSTLSIQNGRHHN
jgi:hypothetical protein